MTRRNWMGAALCGLLALPAGPLLAPGVVLAQSTCTVVGGTPPVAVANSFACGPFAQANSDYVSAIGFVAGHGASGSFSTWVGSYAGVDNYGDGNLGVGYVAGYLSVGDNNVSVGAYSGQGVRGDRNTALGNTAGDATTGDANTAVGYFAGGQVTGVGNAALGAAAGSQINGDLNMASGPAAGQRINGNNNTASGFSAGSRIDGSNNVAIGSCAGTLACNAGPSMTISSTVSLGAGAVAHADGASAIGAGAQAMRVNQVALGTSANTYTMAGLTGAHSTAAQSGPIYFATTDASGNLAASSFAVDTIGNLDGRVHALESGVATLGNEIASSREEARQGIAAAIAMAPAPMPSAPGKTSWAANVGHFKGTTAFGGSLNYRFDTALPLSLNLGYSYAGGESHAARLGLAGEF